MFQPILRYMPHEFRWDVVGTRFYWYVFTMALVVVSLASIATRGFNFGIDFAGGVLIEARAEQVVDLGKLRGDLGSLGLGDVGIATFGDTGRDVMIRVAQQEGGDAAQTAALKKVQDKLATGFEIPVPLERVTVLQAWHPRFHNDPAHRWLRQTLKACCSVDP